MKHSTFLRIVNLVRSKLVKRDVQLGKAIQIQCADTECMSKKNKLIIVVVEGVEGEEVGLEMCVEGKGISFHFYGY